MIDFLMTSRAPDSAASW